MTMKQYQVVGRHKVTAAQPNPKVYRMKLFASSSVVAKSRFWYYLSQLKKVKKANGELLEIHEVFEKKPNTVKNFGFWLRYDSRSGTHNVYKEYRDVSINAAVDKMYAEMASKHRVRRAYVQIVRTAVVPAADVRRANTKQFCRPNPSFRLLHRISRPSEARYKQTFKATAPSTFY